MYRTINRIILACVLTLLTCGLILIFLIQVPSFQKYILNQISSQTGYGIRAEEIHFHAGIKPEVQIQHLEIKSSKGDMLFSVSDCSIISRLPDIIFSKNRSMFSGTITAHNLSLYVTDAENSRIYTIPQVVLSGQYNRKDQLFQISSLEVSIPDTSFSAKGYFQFKPHEPVEMDISVVSPFMTVDVLKSLVLIPLLPQWFVQDLFPAVSSGDIQISHFRLKGNIDQIKALNDPKNAQVMDLNLVARNCVSKPVYKDGPQIQKMFFTLTMKNGRVSVTNLSGQVEQSAFQNSSLVIPSIYADTIRYQVQTEAKLSLADVMLLSNLSAIPAAVQKEIRKIKTIDGTADIKVAFECEMERKLPEILNGLITLQSIRLIHPDLRLPLLISDARIALDVLPLARFDGKGYWGKSEFQVTGSSTSGGEISTRLTTRADVKELIETSFPQISIGNWTYGQLNAEAAVNESGVSLQQAEVGIGKGYLLFKGFQGFRSDHPMHWINYTHIVDEPAENLLQMVKSELLNQFNGSVSLEGVLWLEASNGLGRFSGLNGRGKLTIDNGWIQESGLLLKILDPIRMDRTIKSGEPVIRNGRLYFNRIEGDFEIEKGKLLILNLTLQSHAINAAGAGTLDLNQDQLQLKIGIQLSGIVDTLISKLPLIGHMLAGKDKTFPVLYLDVVGTLSKPEIKFIPPDDPGQSALGYVERLVFTQERIRNALLSLKDPRPAPKDYRPEFDRMTY